MCHPTLSASLFEDTLVAKQNDAAIYAGQEFQTGSIIGALSRNQRAIEARNAHNIQDNYSMGVQQKQYEMQGYWYAPSLIDTPIGYNVTQ